MRILLDECLNWRLARGLPGRQVSSVQRMGWSGVQNGKLLALAEEDFDVFITGDRNLSFQQNIRQTALSIRNPRRKEHATERYTAADGKGR